MTRTSKRILRISAFVLLLCIGLCVAVDKDGATLREAKEKFLSEEKIKIILNGIAKDDFDKARALEMLRNIDPDRFTQEELDKSLKWIEDKGEQGQQQAAELKKIWKENREVCIIKFLFG